MYFPLQARVALLIGGSLVVMQLGLAWLFVSAIEESEALRRQSLQASAQTALESVAADTVREHGERLGLVIDLAREQAAETILVFEDEAPAKKRGFFGRLFGGAPEPAVVNEERRRLSDSISGVREYKDRAGTVWLLQSFGLADLPVALRDRVRGLAGGGDTPASTVVCGDSCVLLSARRFRTTDGVRIVAAAASPADALLAQVQDTSGFALRLSAPPDSDTDGDAVGGWPLPTLGGVPIEPGALRAQLTGSSDATKLGDLRRQYLTLAGWGVLLTLLLLALLMRGVLHRVGTLRHALPKLTMGRFDEAGDILRGGQSKALARDETHDLIQVASTVTDQLADFRDTLQRQATALRGERDHVRLLLDTVPACVVLLDTDTRVQSANRLLGELLDTSTADLANQPLTDHLKGDDVARFAQAVAAAQDTASQLETSLHPPQGDALVVQWHLVQMAGAQVLAVGLDVTNLRKAQHRLHWLADHDEQTGLLNRRALEQRLLDARGDLTVLLVTPARGEHLDDTLDDDARRDLRTLVAQTLGGLDVGGARMTLARLDGLCFAALVEAPRTAIQAPLADSFRTHCDIDITVGGRSARLHLQLLGIDWPAAQDELARSRLLDAARRIADETHALLHWPEAAVVDAACQSDYRHWVAQIDQALADDGFRLVYQPIYDTRTLAPVHSEALLRMRNSDGDWLAPGAFIAHAEQSGQVAQIEHVVLDKVIACAQALQQAGTPHTIAVNITARSLQDERLYQRVRTAVETQGFDPSGLMLEVLETQALNDLDYAASLMQRFKDLGLGIALDDFGIGFTSFEYLRELPFDYVKIDQLFVKQLRRREDDQRLIRSIHDIARGLGRKTIAEGVEDLESLEILEAIGIHAVQGYGLSLPHDAPCLEPASLPKQR